MSRCYLYKRGVSDEEKGLSVRLWKKKKRFGSTGEKTTWSPNQILFFF